MFHLVSLRWLSRTMPPGLAAASGTQSTSVSLESSAEDSNVDKTELVAAAAAALRLANFGKLEISAARNLQHVLFAPISTDGTSVGDLSRQAQKMGTARNVVRVANVANCDEKRSAAGSSQNGRVPERENDDQRSATGFRAKLAKLSKLDA